MADKSVRSSDTHRRSDWELERYAGAGGKDEEQLAAEEWLVPAQQPSPQTVEAAPAEEPAGEPDPDPEPVPAPEPAPAPESAPAPVRQAMPPAMQIPPHPEPAAQGWRAGRRERRRASAADDRLGSLEQRLQAAEERVVQVETVKDQVEARISAAADEVVRRGLEAVREQARELLSAEATAAVEDDRDQLRAEVLSRLEATHGAATEEEIAALRESGKQAIAAAAERALQEASEGIVESARQTFGAEAEKLRAEAAARFGSIEELARHEKERAQKMNELADRVDALDDRLATQLELTQGIGEDELSIRLASLREEIATSRAAVTDQLAAGLEAHRDELDRLSAELEAANASESTEKLALVAKLEATREEAAASSADLSEKLALAIGRTESLEAAVKDLRERPEPAPKPHPPARPPRPAKAEPGEPIDLNSAGFEDLRAVGLSITQAARMIAYRDSKGGFSSHDDLDQIRGLPRAQRAELRRTTRIG